MTIVLAGDADDAELLFVGPSNQSAVGLYSWGELENNMKSGPESES